jgi:hypothetical protein
MQQCFGNLRHPSSPPTAGGENDRRNGTKLEGRGGKRMRKGKTKIRKEMIKSDQS